MSTTSLLRSAALFRAALLCGLLAACGGGGGGGGDAPVPADPPAPPVVVPPPAPLAYLLQSDKVEVCKIDSGDMLVGCVDAGVSGFLRMRSMAVAGSNAYLTTTLVGASAVIHCSIGATGALSACAESAATGFLAEPNGLTVHGSTLYIGNFDDPIVRKCEIRDDGSLDTCVDTNFPDTLAIAAEDLLIVDTTAYVLHDNEAMVSKCDVLPDGTLAFCADANATGLDHPQGFAISGSHMYVANQGDGDQVAANVTRCIIAADGSLGSCEDAGAVVSSPTHIAVRGPVVYITNSGSADSLTRCTAGSNGLLTGCTSVSGNGLYSIALK